MDEIRENLSKVHQDIISSCSKYGRKENEVCLLCVSKTKPEEKIIAAYNLQYLNGYSHFQLRKLLDSRKVILEW